MSVTAATKTNVLSLSQTYTPKEGQKKLRKAIFMGPTGDTVDVTITSYRAVKGDTAHKFERTDGERETGRKAPQVTWYPKRGEGYINGAKAVLPFGADVNRTDTGIITACGLESTIAFSLAVAPKEDTIEEVPNPYEEAATDKVTIVGYAGREDMGRHIGDPVSRTVKVIDLPKAIEDWLSMGRTLVRVEKFED